jgi:hypothetical protein
LKTAPVKSLDTTTKKLLAVFFVVGSLIFVVTIIRLVRTVEGVQPVAAAAADESAVHSGADNPDNPLGLDRKPVIGFKTLPLHPAPTKPEPAQEIYLPPADAHRDEVHRQCEYLREMSHKYPNSPLSLPPEKIDEMERKGILVN